MISHGSASCAPNLYIQEKMFNVSKRIVCPKCGKTLGYRQEEFQKVSTPAWGQKDYVEADFICTDCRKKMEEDIRRRAERMNNEI